MIFLEEQARRELLPHLIRSETCPFVANSVQTELYCRRLDLVPRANTPSLLRDSRARRTSTRSNRSVGKMNFEATYQTSGNSTVKKLRLRPYDPSSSPNFLSLFVTASNHIIPPRSFLGYKLPGHLPLRARAPFTPLPLPPLLPRLYCLFLLSLYFLLPILLPVRELSFSTSFSPGTRRQRHAAITKTQRREEGEREREQSWRRER